MEAEEAGWQGQWEPKRAPDTLSCSGPSAVRSIIGRIPIRPTGPFGELILLAAGWGRVGVTCSSLSGRDGAIGRHRRRPPEPPTEEEEEEDTSIRYTCRWICRVPYRARS